MSSADSVLTRSPSLEVSVPEAHPLTIRDIQTTIGASRSGDGDAVIVGVNAIELAQPDEVTFAENPRYFPHVRTTRAAAVIVPRGFPPVEGKTLLRVDDPRRAFLQVMYLFQPKAVAGAGVHRQAVVAPDAELGAGVTIRECAVIRSRARIGEGTIIESGAHIGEEVSIGAACFIGPNVVIMRGCRIGHRVIVHGGTVIGADGFGYVWSEGRYLKIPQLGNVVIEDDVELGANVCVDRATFGSTVIKRGTKVDNLVQIAHNDVIGEHAMISGQVGLAGSVRVGSRAVLGGQVGVADHLSIGEGAKIGAGSGVIKDVPPGQTVWWLPARPIQRIKRELAALSFLPELVKQLRPPVRAVRRRPKQ